MKKVTVKIDCIDCSVLSGPPCIWMHLFAIDLYWSVSPDGGQDLHERNHLPEKMIEISFSEYHLAKI